MTSKTTLDLGCGKARHPDSIGIDINPDSNADIIHDLNVFPYPFEDNSFDVVFADSIIEHLDDIPSVMNELHRITRSGGKLIVITPYFSSLDAFTDPTHKHFFRCVLLIILRIVFLSIHIIQEVSLERQKLR